MFCVTLNREKRAKGGRWVRSRRRIMLHYAMGWMFIDLISCIPFDLPFALGLLVESQFTYTLKALALVRLLRILKLVQIVPLLVKIMTTKLRPCPRRRAAQ